MIKLRFSKPKYVHNGNVTSCFYKCTLYNTDTKQRYSTFKVEGKATCSKNDTYNIFIGNMIASSKAKYKAYKRVKEDAAIALKGFYDIVKFYDTVDLYAAEENCHVQHLCNLSEEEIKEILGKVNSKKCASN